MSYQHDFGRFQETVKVDGKSYSFANYKDRPKSERLALKKEAVDRCIQANRSQMALTHSLTADIRAEYKEKEAAFRAQPRFQKRYRGRAAALDAGLRALRAEQGRVTYAHLQKVMQPIDGCTYPAAVNDIFTVWESRCETEWEKLERLLRNHDWFYAYSDDYRVWSAGEGRSREIRELVQKLGNDAQEMYEEARNRAWRRS